MAHTAGTLALRARFAGLGIAGVTAVAILAGTPRAALAEDSNANTADSGLGTQTQLAIQDGLRAHQLADGGEGTFEEPSQANDKSQEASTEKSEDKSDQENFENLAGENDQEILDDTLSNNEQEALVGGSDEQSGTENPEDELADTSGQALLDDSNSTGQEGLLASDTAATKTGASYTSAAQKASAAGTTADKKNQKPASSAKQNTSLAAQADTSGGKGGKWIIKNTGAKHGLQRFWLMPDGTYYKGLINAKYAGWWAYGRPEGFVARGTYDAGSVIYFADNNGRLMKTGWNVTSAYNNGTAARYYVDPSLHGVKKGLNTGNGKDVWAHYSLNNGQTLRGKYDDGKGRVWVADNDGRLPAKDGWLVTGIYDGGRLQRYFFAGHAAKTSYFKASLWGTTSNFYGIGGLGYVLRGARATNAGFALANNDGRLTTGWLVSSAFGHGTQRYWFDSNGRVARNRLISAAKEDSGYDAFARPEGYVLRGAYKLNNNWTLIADNDGKLPQQKNAGWLVSSAYAGRPQRYYLERTSQGIWAAKNGYSTKGYAHFTLAGHGYVARNTAVSYNGKSYYADNDGKLKEITSLNGIDISSWNKGIVIGNVDASFIIVKATQGTSYYNHKADGIEYFRQWANQVLATGKLLGFYHYASSEGSAIQQADWFVSKVQPYIGKCVLALDWEGESNNNFSTGKDVSWCKTFLDRVYAKTGVKALIYMSKSVTNQYNWSSVANAGYGLWGAQYKNFNSTGYQSNPWTDSSSWGAWKTPTIFQYSSTGKISGHSGNLDINMFYGNAGEWNKLAAKK